MLIVFVGRVIGGRNIVGDASSWEGFLLDKDIGDEAVNYGGADGRVRLGP